MLPIVQRELLVAARKRTVAMTRVGAGIAAFVAVLAALGFQNTAGAATGSKIFHNVAWLAFWSCFFGGPLLTADCLAVERRNDTLGLLFLTDLKGYDVVLGKLIAKSLTGLFCLVAAVPMLAIPMLLGGVTAGEFWRLVLVLLNTLLFSLSIGMIVSVFSREVRGVIATALLIMVLIAGAPVLFLSMQNGRGTLDEWLFRLYPPAAFFLSEQSRFGVHAGEFYINAAGTFCTSVLLLVVASRRIVRSWHTRASAGLGMRWVHLKKRITQGSPQYRARIRPRLLDLNPVLWLHSRDRSMRVALTIFFVALAGGCYAMNFSRYFHWSHAPSAIFCFLFLYLIFLALVAFESACYLIERRRDGALELILSTALNTEDILRGHWLATRRNFGGALAVMGAYAIGWLLAGTHFGHDGTKWFYGLFPVFAVAAMAVSADALVWCAMSSSFRARWPSLPAMNAFGIVVVLPFFWMLLALPFANTLGGFWSCLGIATIVNAAVTSSIAQKRLRRDFRRKLTEPVLAKPR